MKTENPGKRSITLRWGKPKLHGDDVRRYKVTFDFFYKENLGFVYNGSALSLSSWFTST